MIDPITALTMLGIELAKFLGANTNNIKEKDRKIDVLTEAIIQISGVLPALQSAQLQVLKIQERILARMDEKDGFKKIKDGEEP